MELAEEGSNLGLGSAGLQGGGGESRKGSNRKKNLGEGIELSGELGKREGRRSLSHPFPGLTAGDPHLSASFALLFFSFFLVIKADI